MLTPKVIDINSVVRETEHILRRLIGEDILLSVALLPGGGLVKVDPGHLGQVLINLAVNARDALPSGGGLTIEPSESIVSAPVSMSGQSMPAGRYVRLVVSDTGQPAVAGNEATSSPSSRRRESDITVLQGGKHLSWVIKDGRTVDLEPRDDMLTFQQAAE